MKHLRYVLLLALAGTLLTACREEIDMRDIDMTADLEMGIALPIGQASITLEDVLGLVKPQAIYIDTIHHMGVITLKDTMTIDRKFHPMDLSQYISSTTLTMNVYDQMQAKGLIGANGKVVGTGMPVTLEFPIKLTLQGINGPDMQSKERIDSALIEIASFTSTLECVNNLPLDWDWIDLVTLDLGDHIHRPAGNVMTVYSRGDGYGYDEQIPTHVDNFSIDLMRDHHPATFDKYYNNVDSEVEFQVAFTFTIPAGQQVEIPTNAGFGYELAVQFIDFKALWGMFEPSKDMFDEREEDVSESWGKLQILKESVLPFAEPRIDLNILTEVAGALVVNGDYLYVTTPEGDKVYADFDGQRHFKVNFKKGEYLGLDSKIGEKSQNMHILFDKDPARGHIDRLFGAIPQSLGYKFDVTINQQETPQMRITPNTGIYAQAIANLPLIFKQGTKVTFQDTIQGVNVSQEQIDSLIKAAQVIDTIKATDVKLVVRVYNSIPLDIYGTFTCLDENGNVVMDPVDPSRPLRITEEETLRFNAPSFKQFGGVWSMGEEGESTFVISLTKDKLDMLPKIHSILYTASIDDQSLNNYYLSGMSQIRITRDNRLKVKIGLAAHVGAVINPNVYLNSNE